MNYYERHLGDYSRDTGHLSLLEHGVYTILLDRYYVTEQGIPDSQKYRLARAKSDEERAAVDAVLCEFFCLIEKTQEKPTGFQPGYENEKIWINNRADEEIARARLKINASRENGKKGGRPSKQHEKTQEKPTGFQSGYENETQQKAHQTPITRHQSPISTNKTHTDNLSSSDEPEMSLQACVCVKFQEMGIWPVNPQNQDLLNLITEGAELQDFISAGIDALNKSKGFAYALGIVRGKMEEKKQKSQSPGEGNSGFSKQQQNKMRLNYDGNDKKKQPEPNSEFYAKYPKLALLA